MVDEKVTHFEKQWNVPNVGTIVESDNVFHLQMNYMLLTMFITKRKIKSCLANITYRDMAKLREFGLHIIFKRLQNQVQYRNLEPRLKKKRYQIREKITRMKPLCFGKPRY